VDYQGSIKAIVDLTPWLELQWEAMENSHEVDASYGRIVIL
jgi:hypothetical protein